MAMVQSYVHGEFSSSDASALSEANSRILLYPAGSTDALSVGAAENVVITSVSIHYSGATTRLVQVYDGDDTTVSAGEVVTQGDFAQYDFLSWDSQVGHTCQAGTWPKVKTSGAGQVYVSIRGFILG